MISTITSRKSYTKEPLFVIFGFNCISVLIGSDIGGERVLHLCWILFQSACIVVIDVKQKYIYLCRYFPIKFTGLFQLKNEEKCT